METDIFPANWKEELLKLREERRKQSSYDEVAIPLYVPQPQLPQADVSENILETVWEIDL